MSGVRSCRDGLSAVMPGLVPGIHVLASQQCGKDVDGRDKPSHDEFGLQNP
jgi:hypothetical protein